MGKHLKHLRAEKAKVKLKKKLPKGHNITQTAFQVKKIVIAEQLPEHVGLAVTSKHQTLQDCLNYLNHHNFQKQLDGIRGIRELAFSVQFSVNSRQIRQIVARLLDAGVEDCEARVRRAAIKLLSDLLSQLPAEVKSSFVELLNKQLQRGLSNINPGIQNDALNLIDVLLIASGNQLEAWQPIVELLLRLLTMTGSAAPPRVNVLRRLFAVCSTALSSPARDSSGIVPKTCNERLGPLTSVYKQVAVIPLTGVVKQAGSDVQSLVERIVRGGIGIWTEIAGDRQVDAQKLEVVFLLTRLMLLLYDYVSLQENGPQLKRWFVETFRDLIGRNLLNNFPLQIPQKDQSEAARFLETNINLAVLFMYLRPKKNHLSSICNFIQKPLNVRPVPPSLIPLLDALITERNQQQTIVRKIAHSCKSSPDDKLSNFLQGVALNPDQTDTHQLPEFQEWMAQMITNPKFANTIAKIASTRLNDHLVSAVRDHKEKILIDGNKQLLNILYWSCPHDELHSAANNDKYHANVRNYLKAILA